MKRAEVIAELQRIRDMVATAPARAQTHAVEHVPDGKSYTSEGRNAFCVGYLGAQCEIAAANIDGLLLAMGAK